MNTDRQQEIELFEKSERQLSPMRPELSVLIPTYNRADTLKKTLSALETQGVELHRYEIVVIDDGSSDNTDSVLETAVAETDLRLTYAVLKKNGGPARARNIGLSFCRGSIILNLGDDIEPDLSLLEKHLQFHEENPEEKDALLGFVSFPKKLRANSFMRWLEKGGRNYFFNYAALKAGQIVEPLFFYTCNVSLKASLLEKSGWFDESFPYASHEDLELGYRLADCGMRLVYDPSAKGYHWHVLTISGISRRVYLMGHSADIFWQKVGDRGSLLKRAARRILLGICSLPIMVYVWNRLRQKDYLESKSYPVLWHALLFLGFFIGLSDSSKNRKVRV